MELPVFYVLIKTINVILECHGGEIFVRLKEVPQEWWHIKSYFVDI